MNFEDRLNSLGLILPEATAPAGNYVSLARYSCTESLLAAGFTAATHSNARVSRASHSSLRSPQVRPMSFVTKALRLPGPRHSTLTDSLYTHSPPRDAPHMRFACLVRHSTLTHSLTAAGCSAYPAASAYRVVR